MDRGSLEALRRSFVTACVTGTNGKTTTTTLIAAIVAASGERSARVTTIGGWAGDDLVGTDPTTETFLATAERAREIGVRTIAVETTSQALSEGFAAQWPAAVGVFTNLSRDHLDLHETPERYLAAKAQLFMHLLPGGAAVLNAADPASALLDEVTPPGIRRLAYAARPVDEACLGLPIALRAEEVSVRRTGTLVRLAPSPLADALGGEIAVPLIGAVHAENALAAAVAASALGYDAEAIAAGIRGFLGVPGRFQVVAEAPLVVVDFAHTPDALERTLSLARSLAAPEGGRVIAVFGCGGDRDPGKRGEMGRIAASHADVTVITSDNPRSEDPAQIAEAILGGAASAGDAVRLGSASAGVVGAEILLVLDRREAIKKAIEVAAPADIVVVAGKGHELTQIVGERVIPFDDAGVAKELFAAR